MKYTSECLVSQVFSDSHYDVWVVKMPDMPTETYGIVNKNTGVIENLQPNFFNARALASQFSKWLREDGEPDMSDLLRKMSTNVPVN